MRTLAREHQVTRLAVLDELVNVNRRHFEVLLDYGDVVVHVALFGTLACVAALVAWSWRTLLIGQAGDHVVMVSFIGQVATVSFAALLHLTAVLSVSIGLLNLFPVPLLDGGHLVFYAIEAIRGRPLSEQAQEYGFRVGLALVVMLMLFATWNDIVHLTSL